MDTPTIDSSPRLTRGEYWLLETAAELRIPLRFLVAEDYSDNSSIELMFNKPSHGLAFSQLVARLGELVREGLIAVSAAGPFDAWSANVRTIHRPCQESGAVVQH